MAEGDQRAGTPRRVGRAPAAPAGPVRRRTRRPGLPQGHGGAAPGTPYEHRGAGGGPEGRPRRSPGGRPVRVRRRLRQGAQRVLPRDGAQPLLLGRRRRRPRRVGPMSAGQQTRAPHRRTPRAPATVRAVGVLAAVSTLVGLLTGCEADEPRAGCAWMETQAPAVEAGSTVILVDGSASVRGTKRPDYGQAVKAVLQERVEAGDTFSLGTFGGASGDINWAYRKRSANWKASAKNPANQGGHRDAAVGCLADDVTAAQRAVPADGGTDILAALAAGIGLFDKVKGPRRLLVLSDGLSTTGCADLRAAQFGSEQEIKAIASVCAAKGAYSELPDLHGIGVTFVALGHSAGGQPSANRAQRTWLGRLWTTLCVRGGGAAASCTSSDTPVDTASSATLGQTRAGAPPSASTASVPADPLVSYGNGHSRTYPLPGAALFDTLSARVRPSAVPALTDIADRARTTPGLDRVEVEGYVDPRGGSDNNQSLSQRRADAVGEVLVEHGVPQSRVKAYGRGVSPGCPQDVATDSMSRGQRLQCDRRVDIRIIRK
ncbi:hypothetical protein LK08_27320 [Streptomyces sp. MUSC 125]|nr:hypothetical protein LK08_27320 [Streptomyces sp. MUSC 125]